MLTPLTVMHVRRLMMGMTQTALAREVKTDQTVISLVERRHQSLDEKLAKRIARVLDVSPEDLLIPYDTFVIREAAERGKRS